MAKNSSCITIGHCMALICQISQGYWSVLNTLYVASKTMKLLKGTADSIKKVMLTYWGEQLTHVRLYINKGHMEINVAEFELSPLLSRKILRTENTLRTPPSSRRWVAIEVLELWNETTTNVEPHGSKGKNTVQISLKTSVTHHVTS